MYGCRGRACRSRFEEVVRRRVFKQPGQQHHCARGRTLSCGRTASRSRLGPGEVPRNLASRPAICLVSAGWTRCNLSAARVKFRSSAKTMTACSWRTLRLGTLQNPRRLNDTVQKSASRRSAQTLATPLTSEYDMSLKPVSGQFFLYGRCRCVHDFRGDVYREPHRPRNEAKVMGLVVKSESSGSLIAMRNFHSRSQRHSDELS